MEHCRQGLRFKSYMFNIIDCLVPPKKITIFNIILCELMLLNFLFHLDIVEESKHARVNRDLKQRNGLEIITRGLYNYNLR